MYVKNKMTEDVVSVAPETSSMAAWQTIISNHIRQVPVVEHGILKGILSRTDLLRDMAPTTGSEIEAERAPTAAESMTPNPITVSPDTTIEEAAATMYSQRIGCLPVVTGDNQLEGILTRTDLFDTLIKMIGIDERDTRKEFTFETYEEFLEQANKLSETFKINNSLTFVSEDDGNYTALFRCRKKK